VPLYFAYGSNMDVAAMARRCPRSRPLGLARLKRHTLAIMREGWLTAIRVPNATVEGVLWDIALADMRALDRYEGLDEGLYAKTTQSVIAATGPRRALIYFGVNAGPGIARADYIAGVLAVARHWKLSAGAIAQIEGFAAQAGASGHPASARPRPPTLFRRD